MADTTKNESMFINVDFKNEPDLFDWVQKKVEQEKVRNPDMDRSKFMRRMARREMRRDLRRQAGQADSPTPADKKGRAALASAA